jgi:hypothetical protein
MRFAGAGALVLFLCWQHVQATRLGYRVEAARKQARDLTSRVDSLRMRLDERLSPEAVAVRAERLGMVPAAPAALRRLPGPDAGGARGRLERLLTRSLEPLVAAARS